MPQQKNEPMRGVRYGKFIGPTGRTRSLYNVGARKRDNENAGNRYAYGRDGVTKAKKSIHKDFPHRWLKFGIYNQTKGRKVQ